MTPEEINALPDRVRLYIHELETNADPAGLVQENMLLKDQTRQLDSMIARLRREVTDAQDLCTKREQQFAAQLKNVKAVTASGDMSVVVKALTRGLNHIAQGPDTPVGAPIRGELPDGSVTGEEPGTWDCGCPDGAEDKCVSITCPRK